MENLFVASSNLVALVPITVAWHNRDYLVSVTLTFAMLASVAYHLAETEKHQLPGLFGKQIGREYHHLLINLDRIAAVLAVAVVVNQYHAVIDFGILKLASTGLFYLLLSEYKKDSYLIYLVSHCSWHFMAFGLAFNLMVLSGAKI